MQASQDLRQLLQDQRDQLARLERAVAELEQTDLARRLQEQERRNDELREQNDRMSREAAGAAEQAERILADNRNLRVRLAEEMNRQREVLLADAQKQAEMLFGRAESAEVDRLSQYSANVRARLNALRAELGRFRPMSDELLGQVAELEARSRQLMHDATGTLQRQLAEGRAAAQAEHAALGEIPLDPERIERRPAQRDRADGDRLEMRIGSRITVIVGAFFMLLAVIFGLRYSFVHLQSDVLKGVLAYVIGLVFLGGGELMHRRNPSAFATGICAGGIAILFASTALSYFLLGILSIPLAIILCALVTAAALAQAIRYDAQLIAIFALIGGYLPIAQYFPIGGNVPLEAAKDPVMLLSMMVYFLLLNLFVLLVALRKRWQPLKYFSLLAGWTSVAYLLSLSEFALAGGLFYILANLLLYMAIVLVYPILRRSVLRSSDTVLLGINTVCGCGHLFWLLRRNDLSSLNGAVALALCLLFFILAKWLKVALEKDAGSRGLFYATSFAFWVLAVPLQFEPELISLFWMIEGAALFVFGMLTERKWYRRAGGVIGILCCVSFLPDLLQNYFWNSWWNGSDSFAWRYGVITLGLLAMVGASLYKYAIGHPFWGTGEGYCLRALKGIALVNLWLFALYLINNEFTGIAYFQDPLTDYRWKTFWAGLLSIVATLGFGVLYRAAPRLRTKGVVIIARVLYILGLLMVLVNGAERVPGEGIYFVLTLVLLIALSCGAVLALYDLLRGFGRTTHERLVLLTALYALTLVLQILMVQARFGFRSMAVSFVLIAWAVGFILYGFIGRHAVLRRFGLALSLLSISKLFLLDLYFLPEGQKVISYFVFSIVFIGISFTYQYFARRLFPAAAGEAADRGMPDAPPHAPYVPAPYEPVTRPEEAPEPPRAEPGQDEPSPDSTTKE